jgi:Beta-lactamase superfamily domain
MIITYHDQLHIKLQTGDTVISVNPVSKDSGKKTTRYGADIVLVSSNMPLTNGIEQVTSSGKELFIINSPGEYEVSGISFRGVQSKFTLDGQEKINTSFVFNFDGIRVCALGVLQAKLSPEARDVIGACDLVILPVLEDEKFNYLNPHEAQATSVALEAKIVIPVGYNDKTLPIFLKEAGATNIVPLEKLTIKKKDVDGKDGQVVVLTEI